MKIKLKIMVFGTFDGLHQGHLDFFKQARKLAPEPFLIVSIARDENVKRIKGELPCLNEKKRASLVKECKLVDKVVLSDVKNYTAHIIKESPDIIALGYDQKNYKETINHHNNPYVENLKKVLKNKGLVIKIAHLKPYKEKIYKNHLLKK